MANALDKGGVAPCALDPNIHDMFTQKNFADLISEAHARGHDYYIARVHCVRTEEDKSGKKAAPSYMCYDARQLCKHVFEMVISADGRRTRIKNFKDPMTQRDIAEINFFKLRYDCETPLRAEHIGNHMTFLESNSFRARIFYQENAADALSINFQFKNTERLPYIEKKSFFDVFLVVAMIVLLGTVTFLGIRYGKNQLEKKDIRLEKDK